MKLNKKDFSGSGGDRSYYPLLYVALNETKGSVIECGTGHDSTKLLHDNCLSRSLYSFEHNQEWFMKFTHLNTGTHNLTLITDWRDVYTNHPKASVIFIDHAPGEDRKKMMLDFKDTEGIIVCHDTELGQADHGYRMRQHFSKFKYIVEVKTDGAWATALSNTIDITKYIGEKLGDWTISAYTGEPHKEYEWVD